MKIHFQGRVTCANVLSDLYAMGVVFCDNMLMLLGVAIDMTEEERDIIVSMFIQGFKVCFHSLIVSLGLLWLSFFLLRFNCLLLVSTP